MAVAPVLHTRLLPPRPPPDCLPRADLTDRVLAGLAGRLVAVLAGAGYGKSTLLAQALASRALELGRRDLALSEEEAQTLLRAAGQDLDAVTLAEVYRQSEGWVTGLILASQVSAADLREALASGRLFEYLAEEVF